MQALAACGQRGSQLRAFGAVQVGHQQRWLFVASEDRNVGTGGAEVLTEQRWPSAASEDRNTPWQRATPIRSEMQPWPSTASEDRNECLGADIDGCGPQHWLSTTSKDRNGRVRGFSAGAALAFGASEDRNGSIHPFC
ncbi:hypothetical protein [Amycolatopsis sp. cmx-11-12]|uniref:hypothetical protein n=1 Tax=Amycolatopsis sp. cmx-11-12 TaxID=2785795 RepID=UPI0039180B65